MVATSVIRSWWDPPCDGRGDILIEAYKALDRCLKAHEYAPRRADTGAFNCRKITGGTGYSLHAYAPGPRFVFWSGATVTTALAVDINWQSNPYGPTLVTDMPLGMIVDIKAVKTRSGAQVWRWGGDYFGNKDAMHFEVVCTPGDLRTGINWYTVVGASPAPSTPPSEEEDEMQVLAWFRERSGSNAVMHCYRVSGNVASWCPTEASINVAAFLGVPWWGGGGSNAYLDPVVWKSLAIMNGPLKNV